MNVSRLSSDAAKYNTQDIPTIAFNYLSKGNIRIQKVSASPPPVTRQSITTVAAVTATTMFTVLFEVHPSVEKKSLYLDIGKTLRPELLQVDGFIDNIRYSSLTQPGWILSLSTWRDEKSLVRWRTQGLHHTAQEKGRKEVFLNYRLKICEITADTHKPDGYKIQEQRLDVTRAGDAEAVVLVSMDKTGLQDPSQEEVLRHLCLELDKVEGLVSWGAFNAVLDPGDIIAYLSFTTANAACDFLETRGEQDYIRYRGGRVIRDYGMYNRQEAPQYYPDIERRE